MISNFDPLHSYILSLTFPRLFFSLKTSWLHLHSDSSFDIKIYTNAKHISTQANKHAKYIRIHAYLCTHIFQHDINEIFLIFPQTIYALDNVSEAA